MKAQKLPLVLSLVALTMLAACDSAAPESDSSGGDMSAETPEAAAASEPGASMPSLQNPLPNQSGSSSEQTLAGSGIPAIAQGRWGLVAADCDPSRDDAKGLMVVNGNRLEFYESVGTLTDVKERENNRIRAAFSFTGEGMSWQNEMLLDVQDSGQVLISRQYGEDALPGPMRYMKCT